MQKFVVVLFVIFVSLVASCYTKDEPKPNDTEQQVLRIDGRRELYVPGCEVALCEGSGGGRKSFPQARCREFESALVIHGRVRFCLEGDDVLRLENGSVILLPRRLD